MIEHIITSSALILCILCIAKVFERKINPCLKYGLWLLVVVKLLIPFPAFESSFSVLNLFPWFVNDIELAIDEEIDEQVYNQEYITENENDLDSDTLQLGQYRTETIPIVALIWMIGSCICFGVFVLVNIHFLLEIKKRKVYKGAYKEILDIYEVKELTTPCLFGILHPAIYLTGEEKFSEDSMECILAHEYIHHKHKDHIWSLIRCVCVIVYWFHPLVWVAAIQSKKDSELACDAGTIKYIGNENKIIYGKTLIHMAQLLTKKTNGIDILCCNTDVTGGAKEMKNRIEMLVNQPRTRRIFIASVLVLSIVAMICTTGNAISRKRECITGEQLLEYFPTEEIASITVERVIGGLIRKEKGYELSQVQQEQFISFFSSMKLVEMKNVYAGGSEPYEKIHYFIEMFNAEGELFGKMEFIQNEFMGFEYIPGNKAAVFQKYEILETEVLDILEVVWNEAMERDDIDKLPYWE